MAGAFGFPSLPQTPSPDPREVGRMLAQPQQAPMPINSSGLADEETQPEVGGGHFMGGPGQMGTGSAPPGQPDYPDEGVDANMTAAVGEALTRIAGGVMRSPDMSTARAARRREQLLRLGMTPLEADLLARSGGI